MAASGMSAEAAEAVEFFEAEVATAACKTNIGTTSRAAGADSLAIASAASQAHPNSVAENVAASTI